VGLTIDPEDFRALEAWTENFYRYNQKLFFDRIRAGKIRDCHGDLHMEHICFTAPLSIIDCIEFNDRFRYSDAVADIAFLLMDLEFHEGHLFAAQLWRDYAKIAGDAEVQDLLTFYKVYRAFVRGKVNSFQSEDRIMGSDEREKAKERAKKYFKLARSYI
jgi:aminoglycoside phosphotransferase family enzyme